MCRNLLVRANCWRKFVSTCNSVPHFLKRTSDRGPAGGDRNVIFFHMPGVVLGRGKPMRRRDFIGLLGGAVAVASRPLPVFAQISSKRPLIAAQIGGSKTETNRFFGGFSQGMRELGYSEGHDYGFEVRYADGNVSRIPPQIEELVRLKPDIIMAGTMAGVIAAKKLTDTIPIVCANLTNPIEFGVAASYARPGGNVTGVLLTVEDLPTKLFALALEVVPGANRIGLLNHSDNPTQPALQRSLDAAVNALASSLLY